MTSDLDKETQKRLMKEAIQEWLDKKVRDFGWWSIKTMGAALLVGALTIYIKTGGFK
ncbi:MAG TPA: hypothetical protein VJ577_11435 [Burkholderiaceae bacterium]|nr:hypothetical protein [Burkholderiaceae bacterium]